MQFFVSSICPISAILVLLVAASTVSAVPQPTGVVARDGITSFNHNENDMLKRQGSATLNHDENDMLKHQENTMLKRVHQENTML